MRMQADRGSNKPGIMLYACIHDGYEPKIREIQAGLEEEGVPYVVGIREETDATQLAWQGAKDSQLGVGVGLSNSSLCVHYQKLPANQPLFVADACDSRGQWRLFGYNAARLVKGIPFKNDIPQNDDYNDEMAQLAQHIRQIVMKVLGETVQGHEGVNTWSKAP
jgi:hypothetical protein